MTDRDPDAPFAPRAWVHRTGVVALDGPRIMGVINVTPDSFSDGGKLLAPESDAPNVSVILRRARQMVEQGAHLLDVGGESTRPGADPVGVERELARIIPVISGLVADDGPGVPVSVDTRHAAVASAAVAAGAAIINDVSGLQDPDMVAVTRDTGAGLVIGHMRGDPTTMQRDIRFIHMLREVTDELAAAVDRAVAGGVERPRIVVDPGVGFGKTAEQSAALVAASGWLRQATGCAVMIGASRKSFIGALTGHGVGQRLVGSVTAAVIAAERGASLLRVHDVAETAEALGVASAIRIAFDAHAASIERGATH